MIVKKSAENYATIINKETREIIDTMHKPATTRFAIIESSGDRAKEEIEEKEEHGETDALD